MCNISTVKINNVHIFGASSFIENVLPKRHYSINK